MKVMERFKRSEKGQALVEFAIVLPIFLLLFLAIVDYGRVSTADTQITNATQEAAKEFAHLADTPDYREWYIEDKNKPNDEKRINNELKDLVDESANTVPKEYITVEAERPVDDKGDLGEKVTVKVIAKVPSLSGLTFRNVEVEREVTLRIPSFN